MDFTLKIYLKLLESLKGQGYAFQPFAEYLETQADRAIILRHDVEAKYENALQFARIQHEMEVTGTYYFRLLPNHFNTSIIAEIAALGHEIGYHYDDLSFCKGDYDAALRRFGKNLAILREIAPVTTICMEGAPLSKWDNRDLWRGGEAGKRGSGEARDPELRTQNSKLRTHYSSYGIIGEPYFDIDFTKVLYLTDTGRRWDGKGSVRDQVQGSRFKVQSSRYLVQSDSESAENYEYTSFTADRRPPTADRELKFRHSRDIIRAANASLLPDQIMFTFHPQRWTDKPLPWVKELVLQNVKNVAKRIMLNAKS